MNSRNDPMPLLEALNTISESINTNGSIPPQPLPEILDRSHITTLVSVFKTKDIEGRYAEDGAHVRNLASIVGNADKPSYLDPITVWWGGDRWYLIDGHRRLAAYRLAKVSRGIPVVVFEGTLDDARAQSVALNSKDQMPMTTEDKMNCAWKLSVTTTLSKERVRKACGVAKGSIDNIRAVKATLISEHGMPLEDLAELSWFRARAEAAGRSDEERPDPEEALKKRAEFFRKRLLKTLGDRPARDPDAFALALSSIDRRLPGSLMRTDAWWSSLRQTMDDLKADLGEDAEAILAATVQEEPVEDY